LKKIDYLAWISFFTGVLLSIFIDSSISDSALEFKLTESRSELFFEIIINNLLVCFFLLIGFITAGLSTLLIICYNGYIFGACISILISSELVYLFLSYSILESISFIIMAQIGIKINFYLIKKMFLQKSISIDLKKIAIKVLFALLIIFLSAIIEVHVAI